MSGGFGWTLPGFVAPPSPVPVDAGTKDIFGYDILFKNGDFQLTGGGDHARVGGLENLRQAIYRRLLTRPGEFRFRPAYGAGVGTFVKKAMSGANLDALKLRIVDQLLQDPRIQEVEVNIETATVNSKVVVKVHVWAVVAGNKKQFEPFTFSEAA